MTANVVVASLVAVVALVGTACTNEDTSGDAAGSTGPGTDSADAAADGATADTTVDIDTTDTGTPAPLEEAELTEDPGTLDPVAFGDEAAFGGGVTVEVLEVQATEVEAQLPGEISGPGVVLVLEIRNGSDEVISIDTVTVDLVGLDDAPFLPVSTEPVDPFSGSLEPGGASVGRYAFNVPVDDRDDVRLTVKYSGDAPAVAFTGSLPND